MVGGGVSGEGDGGGGVAMLVSNSNSVLHVWHDMFARREELGVEQQGQGKGVSGPFVLVIIGEPSFVSDITYIDGSNLTRVMLRWVAGVGS